jgi:aminodeoxyfutalosine deaminase
MFSTTLNHEYALAAQLLDLDATGIANLVRAAVDASFLDDGSKRSLLHEIDAYVQGASGAFPPAEGNTRRLVDRAD